jgi:hypothetical protein
MTKVAGSGSRFQDLDPDPNPDRDPLVSDIKFIVIKIKNDQLSIDV